MNGYYANTNCSVISKYYNIYMNQICVDLLEETKNLYYLLFYLEAALFMLFLFSVALVGMIRPDQDEDDDSSSSDSSRGSH